MGFPVTVFGYLIEEKEINSDKLRKFSILTSDYDYSEKKTVNTFVNVVFYGQIGDRFATAVKAKKSVVWIQGKLEDKPWMRKNSTDPETSYELRGNDFGFISIPKLNNADEEEDSEEEEKPKARRRSSEDEAPARSTRSRRDEPEEDEDDEEEEPPRRSSRAAPSRSSSRNRSVEASVQ